MTTIFPNGVGDGLEAMLARQISAAPAETPRIPAANFSARARFVFRTDPGHRGLVLGLPGVSPELGSGDDAEKRQAFYRARYERRVPDPDKRAFYERVINAVGDYVIRFQPLPGQFEGFYQTNDPEIAAYLREVMREQGPACPFYEDTGTAAHVAATDKPHRVLAALRLQQRAEAAAGAAPVEQPITAPAAPPTVKRARKRVNGRFVKES